MKSDGPADCSAALPLYENMWLVWLTLEAGGTLGEMTTIAIIGRGFRRGVPQS